MIKPDFLRKKQIWVWILGICKGQDGGQWKRRQALGSPSGLLVQRFAAGQRVPARRAQGVRTRWDQQPLRPCAFFQEQSPGQL